MKHPVMKIAALAIAIIAATVPALAGPKGNTEKHAINPAGMPANPAFSGGVLVGNTLYISGNEGLADGKVVPGGIAPETTAALGKIKEVLKLAGFQMSDLVSVTVYLADINDFTEMTRVYKTIVPEPRPARTTVQVAALVNNARVEINAIAVKQH